MGSGEGRGKAAECSRIFKGFREPRPGGLLEFREIKSAQRVRVGGNLTSSLSLSLLETRPRQRIFPRFPPLFRANGEVDYRSEQRFD